VDSHSVCSFVIKKFLLEWCLSRFIHVVAPVRKSILFKVEQYSIVCVTFISTFCLFTHSLNDSWVAFTHYD
jgi:hypothetical protein